MSDSSVSSTPTKSPPISGQKVNGYSSINEKNVIPYEQIKLHQQLGRGFYGVVTKGKWVKTSGKKVDVAVKQLHNPNNDDDWKMEIHHLSKLQYPFLISLYGIVHQPAMMVFELCEGGSLVDRLRDKKKPSPSMIDLYEYSIQMAKALQFLESKHCVHRDVAARNILLSKDEKTSKLSDFGLMRTLDDNEDVYISTKREKVAYAWCAPESLHYGHFSHESDVWSFGVTLWEFFSMGAEPWEGCLLPDVRARIDAGERLEKPKYSSEQLYQTMKGCWKTNPYSRSEIVEIGAILEVALAKAVADKPVREPPTAAVSNSQDESVKKTEPVAPKAVKISANKSTIPPATTSNITTLIPRKGKESKKPLTKTLLDDSDTDSDPTMKPSPSKREESANSREEPTSEKMASLIADSQNRYRLPGTTPNIPVRTTPVTEEVAQEEEVTVGTDLKGRSRGVQKTPPAAVGATLPEAEPIIKPSLSEQTEKARAAEAKTAKTRTAATRTAEAKTAKTRTAETRTAEAKTAKTKTAETKAQASSPTPPNTTSPAPTKDQLLAKKAKAERDRVASFEKRGAESVHGMVSRNNEKIESFQNFLTRNQLIGAKQKQPYKAEMNAWRSDWKSAMKSTLISPLFERFLLHQNNYDLEFWTKAEKYSVDREKENRASRAKEIYAVFLSHQAPKRVNVLDASRDKIKSFFSKNCPPRMFNAAKTEVLERVIEQYDRFLESSVFTELLALSL